eukprot:1560642-Amphidinium_carterae.2
MAKQSREQTFTWHEADLKIKWDSARALLADVTTKRPDTGLSTQALRHLKKWKEEPEDLSHILSPHWHKERREVELPADDDAIPPYVKLHGLLPAPRVPLVLTHEPVLVNWTGVVTVWTDGSGKHSDDPQHFTDTKEHVWLPLPGLRRSVYRAEFIAVVRALEECQPHEVVSDCKGVVKAIQALQAGRRTPKGRNRDVELRAMKALLPGQRIRWMKAHLKQADVDSGRVTADDFQGNQQAGLLVIQGPQLRERPEEQLRVKLPAEPPVPPPAAPARVPCALSTWRTPACREAC